MSRHEWLPQPRSCHEWLSQLLNNLAAPDQSLIVSDFTISVYSSSCNCLFLGFILAPLLSFILFIGISKAGRDRWRKTRRKNETKQEIIPWTAEHIHCKIYDYLLTSVADPYHLIRIRIQDLKKKSSRIRILAKRYGSGSGSSRENLKHLI